MLLSAEEMLLFMEMVPERDPRPPVADSKTAPFGKDKKDKKEPVDEKGRKSTCDLST